MSDTMITITPDQVVYQWLLRPPHHFGPKAAYAVKKWHEKKMRRLRDAVYNYPHFEVRDDPASKRQILCVWWEQVALPQGYGLQVFTEKPGILLK